MAHHVLRAWLAILAACGSDRIEVVKGATNDYNHAALHDAIEAFVKAGRTAPAYGELASKVLALRPGMDKAVSRDAELKLMALALAPVQAVQKEPIRTRIAALATTVWPALLTAPIEADEILRKRDPKGDDVLVGPKEDVAAYLLRLCGGPLASDCKQVVPERQGEVVAAIATRRAAERMRTAVGECTMCGAEAGWAESVKAWETLDHEAAATLHAVEEAAAPSNWPLAGPASDADPGSPEAQLLDTGELSIRGERHGATTRIAALTALRGSGQTLAFQVRPDLTVAALRGIYADARKAGATKIALVVRRSPYPYERRVYWLADGKVGVSTKLRPTDPVQLLLDAVDHVSPTPGTPISLD